jgi:hypothetical protein
MAYKNPEARKEYWERNKEYFHKLSKIWREKNKAHIKESNKKYREKNKLHLQNYHKKWYQRNKQHQSKWMKEWHQKNPTWRKKYNKKYYRKHQEEMRETAKKLYSGNVDYYKKQHRDWRENNKEKVKAMIKRFYEKNPHKILEYNSKRRLKFPFLISKEDYIKILKRDDFRCIYCGEKVSTEVPLHHPKRLVLDHIDPNGASSVKNLAVCCWKDNSSKHDSLLDSWVERVHLERANLIFEKVEAINRMIA